MAEVGIGPDTEGGFANGRIGCDTGFTSQRVSRACSDGA